MKDMTFEQLLTTAGEKLKDITTFPAGLPAPQVTVLLSTEGQLYTTLNDTTGEVVKELKTDTHISKMLTVWKGGEVDVAAWRLRAALLELDPQNGETEVLLQGDDDYIVKRLHCLV